MTLEENYDAFEKAMRNRKEGAVKEAFDALITLLGSTDTLDDEFTVWWSFVDDTATRQCRVGYFHIKVLYDYMQNTPDGKSKAPVLYEHLRRISHLGNYTHLPGYIQYYLRPHDGFYSQMYSLEQEENGDVVLYRRTKDTMDSVFKTYRTVVPKNCKGFADEKRFGLVIWAAIGMLMMPMDADGRRISDQRKKARLEARFVDKCTLTPTSFPLTRANK